MCACVYCKYIVTIFNIYIDLYFIHTPIYMSNFEKSFTLNMFIMTTSSECSLQFYAFIKLILRMLKIERCEYIYGNLSAKKCNYTLYILYLKNVFPYNISKSYKIKSKSVT